MEGSTEPVPFGVLIGDRATADPALTLELGRVADSLGYRELWVGELTGHDAFALAVAVACGSPGVTQLALGPLAVGVRDPVTIARGVASVAALTGRPVDAVLGASASLVVEEWHGRSRGQAVTTLAESATALRGLLAGDAVDFAGAVIRTRGYNSTLPPSGAGITMLAIGAETVEAAIGRADRIAVPLATVEHVARLRGRLQLIAERTGRPVPKLAVWVPAVVDPSEQALLELRRGIVPHLRSSGFSRMFAEAGFGDVVQLARGGAHVRSILAAMPLDLVASVAAFGDAASVRAVLSEYRGVGVDDVILVPAAGDAERTLRALAV